MPLLWQKQNNTPCCMSNFLTLCFIMLIIVHMKTKNILKIVAILGVCTNMYAGNIEQAVVVENTPTVDVTTEYSSDKVWRGSDLGQNEAAATVATSLDLPADVGLTLSADYSLAEGAATVSDEATDLTAVFSKSVSDYLLSLSYTWYSEGFDQSGASKAQEVGLSVGREIGPVSLVLTQYLALEGDNNDYSELAALYSNDFNALPVELDFEARVGYLAQGADFTHAELRVSTDLPVTEGIIAQPFVAYSTDLGGEFIDAFSGDNFFGGIQFKRSF
jgi:hypothetical protein